MSFTDSTGAARTIVGVLGGLEVVDLDAGGVLPHERTTPKAVTDRLDLTRATATNLSPVWGLSLASGLTEALAAPGEFVGAMTTEGVEHVVERVTDPARIAEISSIVGVDDVLIADGHHRYSISRTYRDEVRAATGRRNTLAEYTLTFINEMVEDQLSIEAIHRVYTNICLDELRADLAGCFDIEPAPAPTSQLLADMAWLGRLVLLAQDGTAEWLIPKSGGLRRRPGVGRCVPRTRTGGVSGRGRLPARAGRNGGAGHVWAGERGDPDSSDVAHRDRAHRPRRPADAAEVHVLHPEAADGLRDPSHRAAAELTWGGPVRGERGEGHVLGGVDRGELLCLRSVLAHC